MRVRALPGRGSEIQPPGTALDLDAEAARSQQLGECGCGVGAERIAQPLVAALVGVEGVADEGVVVLGVRSVSARRSARTRSR